MDLIYSALPAFITLNPDLVKYLLVPLLEYQASGLYTLQYAMQDMGTFYPNATAWDATNSDLGIEGLLTFFPRSRARYDLFRAPQNLPT